MELRQLAYFVAVAEEASFTRAAARVHVAQPGVSAQVRRLERDLGHALLDRSRRSVQVTEVGAAVLPYARAALDAVDGARLAVEQLTGLLGGHVAVGMVVACSALDVPDLLAGFHRDHPAVEIGLSEDNSDRLIEALRAGRLDLAVVSLGVAAPAGIATEVVVDEPIVAAVSHDDPLAGRSTVTLRAVRERSLISLPAGTGLRSRLDEACAAAGFTPRIACEATDPGVLARLAGRGLGVAILPQSVAHAHRAEVRELAITRPRLRGRLVLAWRAEGPSSPAATALAGHARAALAGATRP